MKDYFLLLKARLDAIVGIHHVGWWNNQFQNENNENAFLYPCVFVEFNNITYQDLTAGIQQVNMDVVLHLGFESYENDSIDFFDIKDLIHSSMQGYSAEGFDHLNRISEVIDSDHSNVQEFILTYNVNGSDTLGHVNNKYSLLKTLTLELNPTFEIDNDIIRTGII